MQFGVLGPLLVTADGVPEPVLVSAGRLRALLAVLLWRANQPVPVDELSELVWDGAPPAGAPAALRALVLRLRRALGPQAGARVRTRAPGYLIELSDDELDSTAFEALCQETGAAIRTGDWTDASATATKALARWRGTPLTDVPCQALRDAWLPHLEQRHLQVLEWRIDADLHLERQDRVVSELRELTARHPLRERFHAQLMLALGNTGRQAEALAAYRDARRVLVDQLGIEPGPELRDLQLRILAGDGYPAQQRDPEERPQERRPVPAQLPSGVSPFVGRADQLAELSRHLLGPAPAATPLALITGTGGCGKTELAVRWARQAAGHFPDGQLYLDLQGYSHLRPLTPLAALGALLRALGVPGEQIPDTQQEAAALFRSATSGRRLLVLLDNASSAEHVRPLIPGDPGCAVLVTSRDRLDGLVARNGARRVPVDVLAAHDAVTLLAHLLGTAHRAADLRRLARACAQLPLALRIAAAHIDGGSPAFLARYVDRLEAGDWSRALRIAGDENSGVHAAFQFSYDGLAGPDQELFRLLGLVPGADFSVAAAGALAGIAADDAQRRLDRLATAHLVGRIDDDRYSCHDLLHAYATELAAAAGPVAEPRRRLAAWYLATVRDATRTAYPESLRLPDEPVTTGRPDAGAAQDWLDREHANVLAMIDQAAADGHGDLAWRLVFAYRPHLMARSYARPMYDAGTTALAAADGDPVGEAAALLTVAVATEKLGNLAEAAEHLRPAADLCDRTGWADGQYAALNCLGVVWIQDGRLGAATTAFERNIAAMRAVGDRTGEAHARLNLGILILMSGRLRDSVDQMRRAADFYLATGPRNKLPPSLAFLGITCRELGEFGPAERLLTDAVTIGTEIGDPYYTCLAEGTLAGVHCDLGDFAKARKHLDRADELVEQTGLAKLAALTALHRGWFELAQERADAAGPWYERVLSYGESAGDPWHRARGLIGLAACLRAEGRATASVRAAARALQAVRRPGYRIQVAQARAELAQTHAEFGDPNRAMAHAGQAARIAQECGHWAVAHTAARVLARLGGRAIEVIPPLVVS